MNVLYVYILLYTEFLLYYPLKAQVKCSCSVTFSFAACCITVQNIHAVLYSQYEYECDRTERSEFLPHVAHATETYSLAW